MSLEHGKIDDPYVPPTAQDAVTIEKETKKEANDFVKTPLECNKVGMVTTRQKKGCYKDLLNDIANDSYLFNSRDEQETKNVCDFVLSNIDQNDILCEDVAAKAKEVIPVFLLPDKRRKNQAKNIFKKYHQNKAMLKKVSKYAIKALN